MSATNYECERGVQAIKNPDRATACAMTNEGANLLKTPVETNYVQMPEIWMNGEPSPKFLSSP